MLASPSEVEFPNSRKNRHVRLFATPGTLQSDEPEKKFAPASLKMAFYGIRYFYRKSGSRRWRKMTLGAMEFLRRFLQHVLPTGFQKVRHYGFASPNSKPSFESVRWVVTLHYDRVFLLLAQQSPTTPPPRIRCPACGGAVVVVGFVPAEPGFAARGPPIGRSAS